MTWAFGVPAMTLSASSTTTGLARIRLATLACDLRRQYSRHVGRSLGGGPREPTPSTRACVLLVRKSCTLTQSQSWALLVLPTACIFDDSSFWHGCFRIEEYSCLVASPNGRQACRLAVEPFGLLGDGRLPRPAGLLHVLVDLRAPLRVGLPLAETAGHGAASQTGRQCKN